MAWDFISRGHAVREVAGLNPGRGNIVGEVFLSNQATGKVFSAEYSIYRILNLLTISPRCRAVSYRP